MNKLQEEFKHFCNQEQDIILVHPKEILDWINQNYIFKQQILNLECLKEEKHSHDCNKNVPELKNLPCDCDNGLRNKLRTEIKEEIKKL